jgi:hypothetical protein
MASRGRTNTLGADSMAATERISLEHLRGVGGWVGGGSRGGRRLSGCRWCRVQGRLHVFCVCVCGGGARPGVLAQLQVSPGRRAQPPRLGCLATACTYTCASSRGQGMRARRQGALGRPLGCRAGRLEARPGPAQLELADGRGAPPAFLAASGATRLHPVAPVRAATRPGRRGLGVHVSQPASRPACPAPPHWPGQAAAAPSCRPGRGQYWQPAGQARRGPLCGADPASNGGRGRPDLNSGDTTSILASCGSRGNSAMVWPTWWGGGAKRERAQGRTASGSVGSREGPGKLPVFYTPELQPHPHLNAAPPCPGQAPGGKATSAPGRQGQGGGSSCGSGPPASSRRRRQWRPGS